MGPPEGTVGGPNWPIATVGLLPFSLSLQGVGHNVLREG